MAAKKVHYREDCSTYGDRRTSEVTNEIRKITCGQCKQTILRTLFFADWSRLPHGWVEILRKLATIAFDPARDPSRRPDAGDFPLI